MWCGAPRIRSKCGAGADNRTVEQEVTTGVLQRVTISSIAPCFGEDLQITSELEVAGPQAVELTVRICGLDMDGDLELRWPPGVGTCGTLT